MNNGVNFFHYALLTRALVEILEGRSPLLPKEEKVFREGLAFCEKAIGAALLVEGKTEKKKYPLSYEGLVLLGFCYEVEKTIDSRFLKKIRGVVIDLKNGRKIERPKKEKVKRFLENLSFLFREEFRENFKFV